MTTPFRRTLQAWLPRHGLLALVLLASAVHAQEVVPGEAAERERLHSERSAADKRLAQAQKACRAKFAVNDCMNDARREYNATVGELKRQERILDDVQRKQRAAGRQKEIDERHSPEHERQEAAKRAKALADQQERDAKAAEKAAKRSADEAEHARRAPQVKTPRGEPGPQGSPRDPHAPVAHGPTPEEAARNRAEYEQRLQEAEKHKAEVAARNAQRKKPASADLPPPPQ
jgi:colicin import membrane protein